MAQIFDAKPVLWTGHIVLFAALLAFLKLAIQGWNLELNLRWVIAVATFSSLVGIFDEYHQSFINGRHATVVDDVIDSFISTVVATLMWIVSGLISLQRLKR